MNGLHACTRTSSPRQFGISLSPRLSQQVCPRCDERRRSARPRFIPAGVFRLFAPSLADDCRQFRGRRAISDTFAVTENGSSPHVCPIVRITGPHADRARRTGSVERRKPASGRLYRTTPRESTMKSAFRGLPAPTFTVLSYSMHRIADSAAAHRETESVCQPSGTDIPRKPWHMIHRWISFCGEPRVAPTQSIDFPIVFEPLRNIPSRNLTCRRSRGTSDPPPRTCNFQSMPSGPW